MNVNTDEFYMLRCLQLAQHGKPLAFPNPLVGAVIVHNNTIIGEGYHAEYGQPHAEVNAVNSVKNKSLLPESTIYVSLEPCSHFGKTPPCSDLIVQHHFQRVVVGTVDPFSEVSGKGIERIQNAGIDVSVGILEEECQKINARFFFNHQNQLPYVILKWAQTVDGFIDATRLNPQQKALKISTTHTSRWVHQLRSEVDGILIGSNTFLLDQPQLTTRLWPGKNPQKILLDPNLETLQHTDRLADYWVYYSQETDVEKLPHSHFYPIKDWNLKSILKHLYINRIGCILVEGGAYTLQQFIDTNHWNSAYKITSPLEISEGTKAPSIAKSPNFTTSIDSDSIKVYFNEIA